MEKKDKADLSDLSQLRNFLTASKPLTIGKIALNVLKRRHAEFVRIARDGFRGDVWSSCKTDKMAVQFID